jgi:putative ABC transport system permease protein
MIASMIARARSWWRGIVRRPDTEADLRAEFENHIALRAADLAHSGIAPEEAARRARAEFGGQFAHVEATRDARGLRWFDFLRFSALDFKLGARMLARYPGLTIVASLAMGVAIAVGAATLTVIGIFKDPHLPLPDGDRIVGIQIHDISTSVPERRIAFDMAVWKTELRSVRELGGFRGNFRNVTWPDGTSEPSRVTAMSASLFRIANTPPLLGRFFVDGDEKAGAPPVAVIGHSLWKRKFVSDPLVVGKTIRLGTTQHTVIGVMPEGFAYPVNFSLWVPLNVAVDGNKPREGPAFIAMGQIAPGATLEQAQADIDRISAALATANPTTHKSLRTFVTHFAQSWFEIDDDDMQLATQGAIGAIVLLLVLISVNIAILVYARTATRQREIAVRNALGASRTRIVSQLFGEALVLAAMGGAIGFGIDWAIGLQVDSTLPRLVGGSPVPFWITLQASPATVRYVAMLAVAGAAIIGILPALRVTGKRIQGGLQSLAGGGSTQRLGGMWTTLIVAQVAITVAVLPTTVFFAQTWLEAVVMKPGFASGQVLSARLSIDVDDPDGVMTPAEVREMQTRLFRGRDELIGRLREDPRVRAASYAATSAGNEIYQRFELDSIGTDMAPTAMPFQEETPAYRARVVESPPGYFSVYEATLIAGRDFGPADADTSAKTIIVNRQFVSRVLGDRNAIGRRIRTMDVNRDGVVRGPWLEIVGVVSDFPSVIDLERPSGAVYRATNSARIFPISIAVRTMESDAATFADHLRKTAFEAEPALQLRDVLPMDDVLEQQRLPLKLIAIGLITVTMSVVILSAAGIYALMSVVVTQRRREIGIRIALGADRRRVLRSIFRRAVAQLGVGVAVGLGLALAVRAYGGGSLVMMPLVAMLAMLIGAIAAFGPARRALRVPPTEVMRGE